MTRTPTVTRTSDREMVRVTASDAEESSHSCGVYLKWKVHPNALPTSRKAQAHSPKSGLFVVADAIARVHKRQGDGAALDEAIQEAKEAFPTLHPGIAAYASNALEQYFEFHESREAKIGKLRFMKNWTTVRYSDNQTAQLAVWGPMYESESGIREVRRLRYGTARSSESAWSAVAARVAADAPGHYAVGNVNVVEVGLLDGSEQIIVDGDSPLQAKERFDRHGKAASNNAVTGTDLTPGANCPRCKVLTTCTGLIRLDNAIQQPVDRRRARSVSANDLARYEECPARWYMESENLPTAPEHSEASLRGQAVHAWLRAAHGRMSRCTSVDLPPPEAEHLGLAEGVVPREGYRLAYPFLREHIEVCPVPRDASSVISLERTVHGYDSACDIVVTARPNMMLRDENKLIVYEVKSTQRPLPADADEARARYLDVAFDLVMLRAGLMAHHSADTGQVNLEVLTPSGARVFEYRTDDATLMVMADGRIRNLARAWLGDEDWRTAPSPHCKWCPVRRWCTDGNVQR